MCARLFLELAQSSPCIFHIKLDQSRAVGHRQWSASLGGQGAPSCATWPARHKCSRMHSGCQLDFVGAELRAEPIMQLQSLSNNLIPDEMKAANCLGKSLARMLHSLYATAKQHSAPQCQQAPRCDSICLALSQQLLLHIHSISTVQYSKSLSHLYLYGLCRPKKY